MLPFLRSQLNDEQYAAAIHTDTSSLILAGAGSGKTRTLIYKIAYMVYGMNVLPSRIFAVTFTNKAAAEMKERLVSLGNKIIDEKIVSDTMSGGSVNRHGFGTRVGTFHGLFLRLLKEDIDKTSFGYTNKFTIYDADECLSLIKRLMKDAGADKVLKPQELKSIISKSKNEGVYPDMYKKRVQTATDELIYKVYNQYQKELQIANAVDFDDILMYTYMMFSQYPEILKKWQGRFDYIMVDEAQDTNRIQFELMKMLSLGGGQTKITLIGDDYQSIYGRRGALMENFLEVKKIWSDIIIYKLQTNYRSKPHIVHAGSAIIKNNKRQYEKTIVSHREGNDKIMIFTHADEGSEALNIIDFISKLKDQKPTLTWSDIAILYRTNAQSQPFEQVLLKEGIPYKIFGAFRFFDRKEVKDIISYIKYILNPRDNIALKRIINIPNRKIGDTTIGKIESVAMTQEVSLHDVIQSIDALADQINKPTIMRIKEFMTVTDYIHSIIPTFTPSQIIKKILSTINYKDYLLDEEDGNKDKADDRYQNVGQLVNMAEKFDGVGLDELIKLIDEISLLTDAAAANEVEQEAIKLMSIHTSKGLEFPYVFIVGAEEGIFPLAKTVLEVKLLEEERRLMYVAVTRAADHLFISHANARLQRGQMMYNQPSRFLEEIPEELKKAYDLTGVGGSSREVRSSFDEGDEVNHKLFGDGHLLEIRGDVGLVKFYNVKFGVRKIPLRLLGKK